MYKFVLFHDYQGTFGIFKGGISYQILPLNAGQKELKKGSFDASVWIIAKFAAFFFVQKATIAVVMVEKYRVSMILHFCCVYRKRK